MRISAVCSALNDESYSPLGVHCIKRGDYAIVILIIPAATNQDPHFLTP